MFKIAGQCDLCDLTISDIVLLNDGESITTHGMLHSLRAMKDLIFLILRKSDGLLQCVCKKDIIMECVDALKEESAVVVGGNVKIDARAPSGIEIIVTEIKILSQPEELSPVVINKRKINVALDNEIGARPLTLRNDCKRSVFKLQEGLVRAFRDFLCKNNFTEIFTPKIVANGAEGGANIFTLDYFQKKAYLAQSPQFYKQMLVAVYERVFEISHVYRAEKHDTARHLNEYISVDFEMGFIDSFFDVMNMETAMLNYAFEFLKENYLAQLKMLNVKLPVINQIPCFEFSEAKAAVSKKYSRKIRQPYDLEPEEERLISQFVFEECQSEFVFITHYPAKKRPFYAMEDPVNSKYTLSFDLLFRGIEVTTGGQRIHDYSQQITKMTSHGLNPQDFESYLMLHKYGCPPHGGLGMGLERLLLKLLDETNIRAASMFPRDTTRIVP